MANPTWRYHKKHGGRIFDADKELPSEKDGWYDHPSCGESQDLAPHETPVPTVSWPDPSDYADVDTYMGLLEERMPQVPTEEGMRASGERNAEKIEDTIRGAREALQDSASSALRYYAVKKYGADLDGRYGPERLLAECRKLDEGKK